MRRKPWIPTPAVEHLETIILECLVGGRECNVLEWGGGGSTVWFDAAGCYVVTVEHNLMWASQIRKATTERVMVLQRHRPYYNTLRALPGGVFDIVLIDGRDRVACVPESIRLVRPGGYVVLDDSSRNRYADAHRQLQGAGFVRERFGIDKPTAPNGKRMTDFYCKPKQG